jgi:hypothetical protein
VSVYKLPAPSESSFRSRLSSGRRLDAPISPSGQAPQIRHDGKGCLRTESKTEGRLFGRLPLGSPAVFRTPCYGAGKTSESEDEESVCSVCGRFGWIKRENNPQFCLKRITCDPAGVFCEFVRSPSAFFCNAFPILISALQSKSERLHRAAARAVPLSRHRRQ